VSERIRRQRNKGKKSATRQRDQGFTGQEDRRLFLGKRTSTTRLRRKKGGEVSGAGKKVQRGPISDLPRRERGRETIIRSRKREEVAAVVTISKRVTDLGRRSFGLYSHYKKAGAVNLRKRGGKKGTLSFWGGTGKSEGRPALTVHQRRVAGPGRGKKEKPPPPKKTLRRRGNRHGLAEGEETREPLLSFF